MSTNEKIIMSLNILSILMIFQIIFFAKNFDITVCSTFKQRLSIAFGIFGIYILGVTSFRGKNA